MKRKYSTEELVQLFDAKDWKTLWKIMQPMVKHAVKRCMQEGLDPFYVRDDLMQEAYLAAWESLPRWNAFEAGLQTWVSENVRGAMLKANARESSGMIGGRDNGVRIVSLHGKASREDLSSDDAQRASRAPELTAAYQNPPEGFGDPSDEADDTVEDLLSQVPEEDRDMVRRLCGIGVPAETQEEYAAAEEISVRTVKQRLADLRKYFRPFLRKLGNQETTSTQTQGKAA